MGKIGVIKRPGGRVSAAGTETVYRRRRVCVVTRRIADAHHPDETVALCELAKLFASTGDDITLLWAPASAPPASSEAAKLKLDFQRTHAIRLEILQKSDQLLPNLSTAESRSAALLHHLEDHAYDLVYAPLEDGLAYYPLLAVETGVYDAPPIIVVAHAPQQWAAEADKVFPTSTQQIAVAHMERYCAEAATRLVCASVALRAWMVAKGWRVKRAIIAPPLLPDLGLPERNPDIVDDGSDEVVLLAGTRFRDGLTLFCDALDRLAATTRRKLVITAFGPFDRILGEHTGGLLLRRARRWPFRLNLFPDGGHERQLYHLARGGGLAVIPALATSTGGWVSACVLAGLPFVATNVGANAEAVSPAGADTCLAAPKPADLARAILAALKRPPRKRRLTTADQHRKTWLDTRDQSQRRRTKRPAPAEPLPFVSIVMAHRNRPDYLRQAIAAIQRQTYGNIELVLVDDGSDQADALRLLDKLQVDFRRRKWRVLRQPHRHLGAARNAGVRVARGHLILFVDDDNALFPEAVEILVRAMTLSRADICTSFQLTFYEDIVPEDRRNGLIQYLPLGGSNDLGLISNVYGDANAMIRRSVFAQIGPLVETPGYSMHDWEFFARASLAGLKVRTIPKPLYWYRSRPDGMFRSSHWHDNRLPIFDTFRASGFENLDSLHELVLGQNTPTSEMESARANLQYGGADGQYIELCDLEPNSGAAIDKLAALALSSGRADTASTLTGAAMHGNSVPQHDVPAPAPNSILLGYDVLKTSRLLTPRHSELPLLLIAPDSGVFLRPHPDGAVGAVLDEQFPPFFRGVKALVEIAHAQAPAVEFGVALLRPDTTIDWQEPVENQTIAFSGWRIVSEKFVRHQLQVTVPALTRMRLSIVVAIKANGESLSSPANAFFRQLSIYSDG
jgi:GT2 family glycosyltransferase